MDLHDALHCCAYWLLRQHEVERAILTSSHMHIMLSNNAPSSDEVAVVSDRLNGRSKSHHGGELNAATACSAL
jgi:hypothetical protein